MKRYALIYNGNAETVERYLPGNYSVVRELPGDTEGLRERAFGRDLEAKVVLIEGRDNAGWTMNDYVLPRLASGLYHGEEIDLSHPVMKQIPV